MHNMNIEDDRWAIDERLAGSKPDRLKGCAEFIRAMPIQMSSVMSRRNSFLGDSSFKDFRDYCKGSVDDIQVSQILFNMDKLSHFGSIEEVIARNADYRDSQGKRNIR